MKTKLCALLIAASLLGGCDHKKDRASKDDEETSSKEDGKAKKSKQKDSASPASSAPSAPPSASPTLPTAVAPTAATPPPTAATAEVPPISSDVTKPNIGTPESPVLSPTQQSYSMAGIQTIPDTCSNAHVILVQAPESVGVDYEWKYSRQAMLANQQYQVVSGTPSARGQVSFQVHQANEKLSNAFVLVASCADGVTCNHLAAMYRSIVKTSNPQVFCGDVPAHLGPIRKRIHLLEGGPLANLPRQGDVISQCARLAACTIADKTDTSEDVGISCQKAPQSYRTDCATRYPCAEVLACSR
jgi:hypothetical protein